MRRTRVDLVVLTPLIEEWEAMKEHLDGPLDFDAGPGDYLAVVGELGRYRAVVCKPPGGKQSGNYVSAAFTERMISEWKPRWILLVGIAGSLNSCVKPGDVVLVSYVYGYDFGKIDNGQFARRSTHDSSIAREWVDHLDWLKKKGLAEVEDEWKQLTTKVPSLGELQLPRLHYGPIASGEKVVDDLGHAFINEAYKNIPDAIAVEMEAAGAATAVRSQEGRRRVGFLSVRGISDVPRVVNQDKQDESHHGTAHRDEWKEYAAACAAFVAKHLLSRPGIPKAARRYSSTPTRGRVQGPPRSLEMMSDGRATPIISLPQDHFASPPFITVSSDTTKSQNAPLLTTQEVDTLPEQYVEQSEPGSAQSKLLPNLSASTQQTADQLSNRTSASLSITSGTRTTLTDDLWSEPNTRPQILAMLESTLAEGELIPTYILEYLFPSQGLLFGPSGQCALWWLAKNGLNSQLKSFSRSIMSQTAQSMSRGEHQHSNLRSYLCAAVLSALADCNQGFHNRAIQTLDAVQLRISENGLPELLAWCLNIRSIISGKLGDERRSDSFAREAIVVADGAGIFWLSTTIKLRMIHRADWNAWESGLKPDDFKFETTLESGQKNMKYADARSILHIEALRNAVQALHYSWEQDAHERALTAAEHSIYLLSSETDHDEKARMISEIGRIKLKSLESPLDSITYFKRSAPSRLSSGNIARLRYDLLWLAHAYQAIDDRYRSGLCAYAALAIHQRLYGKKKTDSGLVRQIRKLISELGSVSQVVLNRGMLYTNSNAFGESTGIEPLWWYNLMLEHLDRPSA